MAKIKFITTQSIQDFKKDNNIKKINIRQTENDKLFMADGKDNFIGWVSSYDKDPVISMCKNKKKEKFLMMHNKAAMKAKTIKSF